MRLRAALALTLLLGCGPTEAPATPSEPEPEAPAAPETPPSAPETPPTEPETPSEPSTPAPPEGVCERARACCRAYVAAIPSARRPLEERGCQEMDTVLTEAASAADEACEAAIGGWRQSLQLTGIDVPEACR